MIQYNTQTKQLILPEYGRNIQQMVDFCMSIENREERTKCAYAIIDIMGNLFPDLKENEASENKLWDHLYVMSDFRLDIDYPCKVVQKDELNPKPERIPYSVSNIKYRHYGNNIEQMINVVAEMEEGEERSTLISMIAHHMKKLMLIHNKEGVDDAKILRDLAEYSHGKITLDPNSYFLHEFKEDVVATSKSKSKSKKKKK